MAQTTGKKGGHAGLTMPSLNYFHQLFLSLYFSPRSVCLFFSLWHHSLSYWIYPSSKFWEKKKTWLELVRFYIIPLVKTNQNCISIYKSPGKTDQTWATSFKKSLSSRWSCTMMGYTSIIEYSDLQRHKGHIKWLVLEEQISKEKHVIAIRR